MKVIGITTRYLGEEFPNLRGLEVCVLAVLREALLPGVDAGAAGYFLTTDEELAQFGGVRESDRIAVVHVRTDGGLSSVRWSSRAVDLEAFSSLRG